jgi:hypothetical protein
VKKHYIIFSENLSPQTQTEHVSCEYYIVGKSCVLRFEIGHNTKVENETLPLEASIQPDRSLIIVV